MTETKRSNRSIQRRSRSSKEDIKFTYLRWLLIALEGLLGVTGIYFIQNQLSVVLVELRTSLWTYSEHLFFDKWDYVHWGSSLMSVLLWPDRRLQREIVKMGLIVILGFEVVEQMLVCKGMTHRGSCEPWQDTTKDVFTGVLGLTVGYFLPEMVHGISSVETISWTFATVLFVPHWWWFTVLMKVAECFIAIKLRNHPQILRMFFVSVLLFYILWRHFAGTLLEGLIAEAIFVSAGIQLVMRTVMWLDSRLLPWTEDSAIKITTTQNGALKKG